MSNLFDQKLNVINVGLESFKTTLDESGTPAVQMDWRPPLAVSTAARDAITAHRTEIDQANRETVDRIIAGKPYWIGLGHALECIPGMHPKLILHAGPPITWERMCGPMRGAIIGALLYEGLAADEVTAEQMAASGEIEYAPCHEHATVGPMAGIVSASMPVSVVFNATFGNYAYTTLNEGLGKVLRYGAYSPEVLTRLKWMERVLFPVLQAAVAHAEKIDLKAIIAQALHMGDEVHNRNRAATSLLYRTLATHIVRTAEDYETAAKVLDFINGNDHFFLNLSMASGKACLDAARDIPNSSVAIVMARNGTDFGIQLSGTGNRWFTGPAPVPDALFFPGFTKADANPDIGDSAITETYGLGGFAIAASPAIVQFVGGQASDALQYTLKMYDITTAENPGFQIPALDFRGTPIGIDVRKVVDTGILPFIDTGVAHKKPGIGQVGAGVLSAPPEPFINAFEGFSEQYRNA